MKRSIMLGGCGSSGTTLVGHLLNGHPDIYCGPELSVLCKRELYAQPFPLLRNQFRQMLEQGIFTKGILDLSYLPSSTSVSLQYQMRLLKNAKVHGYSVDQLCQLSDQCKDFPEFIERYFKPILACAGKSYWAEKTPSNCYCIGEFLETFPSGKYVHVVRDGRDVVASLIRRGFAPANAVRRWAYDSATGLRFRKHSRYYEVRYETLVHNPKNTLDSLMDFLGYQAFDSNSLMITALNQNLMGVTHPSWTTTPNEIISAKAIGKWKRDSYPEKFFIEHLFRYTRFQTNISQQLDLPKKCTINTILSAFEYDPEDNWNSKPYHNWGFNVKHCLREDYYAFKNHVGRDYFLYSYRH